MTERLQVYRCEVCGNIVEVLHSGVGELVCCGQPMTLLEEKAKDVGLEKHVPVIEKTEAGIKVKVGSIPHPMEEKHYIEWIELIADDQVYRAFLKLEISLRRSSESRRKSSAPENTVAFTASGNHQSDPRNPQA